MVDGQFKKRGNKMFEKKGRKPRMQFNPNPQRQPGGFKPQPIFGQQRKPQPSPFGPRQPQPMQPQQNIPAQPTNELQNEVYALQQEIETLKRLIIDSDSRFTELQNQVVGIIEYLNQPEQ